MSPSTWNAPTIAADCAPGLAKAVQAAVNEIAQSEAALVRTLAILVERMRIGQERALKELYDATVGKLYALASAILRSPEEAEEIVCETYAYAWANAARPTARAAA